MTAAVAHRAPAGVAEAPRTEAAVRQRQEGVAAGVREGAALAVAVE